MSLSKLSMLKKRVESPKVEETKQDSLFEIVTAIVAEHGWSDILEVEQWKNTVLVRQTYSQTRSYWEIAIKSFDELKVYTSAIVLTSTDKTMDDLISLKEKEMEAHSICYNMLCWLSMRKKNV